LTVDRTPWTGDQPEARPVPTHRTTQKIADTRPCLDWDSNPLSQFSSGRRQYVPQTARPLGPAVAVFNYEIRWGLQHLLQVQI